MRYATLGGGKRLRAFLVMESAALFAVSETCAARVAAAVEMLHAYSLVHDDLPAWTTTTCAAASRSTTGPSTRRPPSWPATRCRPGLRGAGGADTHSDPQARCELVAALGAAAGARGMAGGQMIDMLAEGQTLDAPAVTRLQPLKTGRLIQFSAEAGAMLGRAPLAQRHLLRPMGATSAPPSRSPTTCWMPTAAPRRSARRPARTPRPARRRMVAMLGVERAGHRPTCWPPGRRTSGRLRRPRRAAACAGRLCRDRRN